MPRSPGLELAVKEAFQILMSNWMPPIVLSDLTAQTPSVFRDMATGPPAPP
jgi:hypothetical protein